MSPARQKKNNGEFKETCIGVWSRSMMAKKADVPTPLCMGILFVRLKNKDLDSVQPTNTVGLQIILQDTEIEEDESPQTGKVIWQQETSTPVEMLSTFKQKSEQLSNSLKDFLSSSDRLSLVNKVVNERYKQLRDWSEKFWK